MGTLYVRPSANVAQNPHEVVLNLLSLTFLEGEMYW